MINCLNCVKQINISFFWMVFLLTITLSCNERNDIIKEKDILNSQQSNRFLKLHKLSVEAQSLFYLPSKNITHYIVQADTVSSLGVILYKVSYVHEEFCVFVVLEDVKNQSYYFIDFSNFEANTIHAGLNRSKSNFERRNYILDFSELERWINDSEIDILQTPGNLSSIDTIIFSSLGVVSTKSFFSPKRILNTQSFEENTKGHMFPYISEEHNKQFVLSEDKIKFIIESIEAPSSLVYYFGDSIYQGWYLIVEIYQETDIIDTNTTLEHFTFYQTRKKKKKHIIRTYLI